MIGGELANDAHACSMLGRRVQEVATDLRAPVDLGAPER